MWDRRFLFSDDQVIKRLQTEFVPVVGNTHEIQNGRNKVRDWFLPVATKLKPDIAKGQTSQGFYVIAADGTGYGFNNNRSVERVMGLMDRGLAAYKANPPAPVAIGDDLLNERFAIAPPEGTSVVRVFTRIKPIPLGCDSSNANVAREHLWILPEEARALSEGQFPAALGTRLCRFVLVDNVRGEPDFWRTAEVRKAEFSIKKGVLSGTFAMSTADGKRGLEGKLEGVVAVSGTAVTSFKAYGTATAWGAGTYTPNPPESRFPLVFAFVSARDELAKAVAPQGALWGREYLAGQ